MRSVRLSHVITGGLPGSTLKEDYMSTLYKYIFYLSTVISCLACRANIATDAVSPALIGDVDPAESGFRHYDRSGAYRLQNLRLQRIPLRPWEVHSASLSASVQVVSWDRSSGWELDIWAYPLEEANTIEKFLSMMDGVNITQQGASGRRYHLRVSVNAPWDCHADASGNTTVTLSAVVTGQERKRIETLAVDNFCLIGSVVRRRSAVAFAAIASKHASSPVITSLAEGRGEPTSLYGEIDYLRKKIQYDPDRYRRDPFTQALDPVRGGAYALSPWDTLRLGGDCEDWAIVIAAYLVHRGIDTWIATTNEHAWVRARDPFNGLLVDIDWMLATGPEECRRASIAAVHAECDTRCRNTRTLSVFQ